MPLGPRQGGLPPKGGSKRFGRLGDEVPRLIKKLECPNSELTDAELTRVRGRVQTLSRQGLQALRNTIEHKLPKHRKHALRNTTAFKGAATVDKVMEALGGPGRLGRLTPIAKKSLRDIRAQNVEALLARAALRIVNGNDGLFAMINPASTEHPEGRTIDSEEGPLDSVSQRYHLLKVVSGLLRVGIKEEKIVSHAVNEAGSAMLDAQSDGVREKFEAVIAEASAKVSQRAGAFAEMNAPEDMSHGDKAEIGRRLSQVRWIEARVHGAVPAWKAYAPSSYTDDLKSILGKASGAAVREAIDHRFETVMNFAVTEQIGSAGLAQLDTVKYERHPSQRIGHLPVMDGRRLPASHVVAKALAELDGRLSEGELSAVGGDAYATQTFTTEVLDRVVSGEVKVVAFDGSKTHGVDYIRDRYGITKGTIRLGARTMGLQGIYGSYPRTVVTLDDGQQFLLVTGYGASRQINNAATLLLYADDKGQRVSASAIDLATDRTDLCATLKQDIRGAIKSEWGDREGKPDSIPTRLMILQNPTHLEQRFGDAITLEPSAEHTMVPFHIGYRTLEDGRTERVIVPKVGGGGLYGDTAGNFLTAFFESGFDNLIPDVIFNGAAGGFAGTQKSFDESQPGLPKVEPGGLIMPTKMVEQHGDGKGPQPIPSMLGPDPSKWPVGIQLEVQQTDTHLTGSHVAVLAPAIETFTMIHDMVDAQHASIDVEAGSIMEAARKLGKTCTVLYTHSDDPRASQANPNASLGMVAPFLEGSRYHSKLFTMIDALWQHSADEFAAAQSAAAQSPAGAGPSPGAGPTNASSSD